MKRDAAVLWKHVANDPIFSAEEQRTVGMETTDEGTGHTATHVVACAVPESDAAEGAAAGALPQLPCYPCPYNASCCAYGTSLTDAEAMAIDEDQGSGLVYRTRAGDWRTRVRGKRCVFLRDGGCAIHDKPYYPAVCRGFPWTDAETGGRYEYDISICGEFAARPHLVAIQRAGPHLLSSSATPPCRTERTA
jgi:hypothetical protein